MRKRRTQHQRSSLAGFGRWLILGLLAAGLGSAVVCIRNQHVAKGDRKRGLEREIRQLEKEIEALDNRIASVMDRDQLIRSLHMHQSDLISIDTHQRIINRVYIGREPERLAAGSSFDQLRETPYAPRH